MPAEVQQEQIFGPRALPELQWAQFMLVAFVYLNERPEKLSEADLAGDRQASSDLIRLWKAYTDFRYLDVKNRPKVDGLHWIIFMLGWRAGLQELTEDELASAFQEVCPCRKKHNADALRKQRDRAAKVLEKFKDVFYVVGSPSRKHRG